MTMEMRPKHHIDAIQPEINFSAEELKNNKKVESESKEQSFEERQKELNELYKKDDDHPEHWWQN